MGLEKYKPTNVGQIDLQRALQPIFSIDAKKSVQGGVRTSNLRRYL